MSHFIHHLPANFETFFMCQVTEIEYVLKIVVDGEVLDLGDNCGLEHDYPLSFDLDSAPDSTISFVFGGGATCFGADGVEHDLFLLRQDGKNLCQAYFVEDLTSKEDLREMIEEISTMESWERKHFLEWVTTRENALIAEHGGRYSIFGQEDLIRWVELYYRRDVVVLSDFVLENLLEQELDLHFQAPHPEAFKEFSADHALVPVERQSKYSAVKGDTVVIFNGKSWKIIYVF